MPTIVVLYVNVNVACFRSWIGANADEAQKQYEKTLKLEEELKLYLTGTYTVTQFV